MRCDSCRTITVSIHIRFQSTHLHEVWLELWSTDKLVEAFQSTHLHEVWLSNYSLSLSYIRFNPHTYMRCDPAEVVRYNFSGVSIHTPTWGVTIVIFPLTRLRMFQSTHLHEVWQVFTQAFNATAMFQSTHLHEVWPWISLVLSIIICFNPHTYMRCDYCTACRSYYLYGFNPHTYMRCD